MQFVKAPFVFKCSFLKHHLFSKNIIQSFLCDCEDSKHFLLDCPLYINLRQEIIWVISNLCIPTLNVLLCGNQTLSFDVKDCLPYLFHGFRNKYFNKISLDNMLYFQNKLSKF